MALGPLPSPGPFGRIVDVRVWPHGFTTQQGTDAGPVGSAIVRPNIEDADWHASGSEKWGGNIVWTGSTPRHTIAYNGPRGRWWGAVKIYDGSQVQRPFQTWFAYNGASVAAPSGRRVLGACLRVFDDLPTTLSYAGTGNGALTVQSPATAAGVLTGDYEVRCIETGATPRFLVTGPDAVPVGVAEAGPVGGAAVPFDSVVRFTLQSGSIGFAIGDAWTLTVEEAEQLIALAQVMGGPTSGPDNAAADEVYRRGVSLTGPWRLLASIPPQGDEYFPVPQPWFINASGTQAVTTRTVVDPANGSSGLVRLVDLDLRTFAVTRDDQGVNTFTWTAHIDVTAGGGGADYFGTASRALSTLSATLWRDWAGEALITCAEETRFSLSHTWDGETASGAYFHASGSRYAGTDVVITHPGGEWRRTVYNDSISATFNGPDLTKAAGRTLTHAPLHSIAITNSGVVDLFESDSTWAWSNSGWTDTYTTTESSQVRAVGAVLASRGGGGSYTSSANDASGPAPFTTWYPFGYPGWSGGRIFTIWFPDPDAGVGQSIDIPESTGGGPRIGYDTGVVLSVLGVPLMFTTGSAGGQVNNRLPAVIGGTWALDTRSNYLQVVEVPQISGGFQHQGLFPMAAGNATVAGSTGSGTYLIKSGGPDSLTPSQVHTLTGHPGADLWNIGAF